jgi:4-hydroxy-2-oxoglutarate aldolase
MPRLERVRQDMDVHELAAKLTGVFAPISTPFAEDESVDLAALRYNLQKYAQTQLHGYMAIGSNGENKSLTEKEKLLVLETVVQHKGPGQVVMAGATYEAQRDTERFLKLAADLGADFGVVLPPSYFRAQMTDKVLFRYYSTAADASPIPILLYNAPKFCGLTLSPELVRRLAPHPNVVGIKDSASSGIEDFIACSSESFLVLAGSISFLFPAMRAGAVGGTVSLANSFPHIAVTLFQYGTARDEKKGAEYQAWAREVNKAVSGKYGVAGVKAAMELNGFVGGIPRRPLLPLSEAQRHELRAALIEEGVL